MTLDDFLCGRELRTLFCFPNYSKSRKPLAMEENEDNEKWLNLVFYSIIHILFYKIP